MSPEQVLNIVHASEVEAKHFNCSTSTPFTNPRPTPHVDLLTFISLIQ